MTIFALSFCSMCKCEYSSGTLVAVLLLRENHFHALNHHLCCVPVFFDLVFLNLSSCACRISVAWLWTGFSTFEERMITILQWKITDRLKEGSSQYNSGIVVIISAEWELQHKEVEWDGRWWMQHRPLEHWAGTLSTGHAMATDNVTAPSTEHQGTNLPSTWHPSIGLHGPQRPKSQRRDSSWGPREAHF